MVARLIEKRDALVKEVEKANAKIALLDEIIAEESVETVTACDCEETIESESVL